MAAPAKLAGTGKRISFGPNPESDVPPDDFALDAIALSARASAAGVAGI
jgi:hypothetical protein